MNAPTVAVDHNPCIDMGVGDPDLPITGWHVRSYMLTRTFPLRTACVQTQQRKGWLFWLRSGSLAGVGDIAPWPGFGADTTDVAACVHALGCGRSSANTRICIPELVPTTISWKQLRRWDRHLADSVPAPVRHGLTTAALDLVAQAKNLSLAHLLSCSPRETIPVAAVVETPEQALAAVQAGIRCLKLKLGAASPETDLRRVAAVRGVHPDVSLRVDANGAWSRAVAAKMCEALHAHGVQWVEQPLPADDLEGLLHLQHQSPLALALDETLAFPALRAAALAGRIGDIWVLKPSSLGGLLACLDVHTISREAGIETCVSFAWTSAVGQRAAVCLAAVCDRASTSPRAAGLTSPWTNDVATPLCPSRDGVIVVPTGPGLGLPQEVV